MSLFKSISNFATSPFTGAMGLAKGAMPSWQSPADQAMPYLNQIPDQLKSYYEPYMQAGQNPGQKVNEIGQGYQQSPGYQFALQQALQAGNNAGLANRMAGTPAHEQQQMQIATGLANQDYNNWLGNAMGVYGQGFGATNSLAQSLSDNLLSKASFGYEGAAGRNQHRQGQFGNIVTGLGALAAFL